MPHIPRPSTDNAYGKDQSLESAHTTIDLNSPVTPDGMWRWREPLDIDTCREFHAAALEMMRNRKGQLILDLSEAPHMDACGLQVLLAMAIEALNRGRFFEIAKASYAIQRDLQLAGVSYLMRQE